MFSVYFSICIYAPLDPLETLIAPIFFLVHLGSLGLINVPFQGYVVPRHCFVVPYWCSHIFEIIIVIFGVKALLKYVKKVVSHVVTMALMT
jgi:hypothetical protein